MTCNRVRKNLSAHLDRELPPRAAARVAAHIETCAACRARLAELERQQAALSRFPAREPSPFLWTRLEARLSAGEGDREPAARPFFRLQSALRPAGAVLAALLVLAAGIFSYRQFAGPGRAAEIAVIEDLELYEHLDLLRHLEILEGWEG